jgi:hypothetical protein
MLWRTVATIRELEKQIYQGGEKLCSDAQLSIKARGLRARLLSTILASIGCIIQHGERPIAVSAVINP